MANAGRVAPRPSCSSIDPAVHNIILAGRARIDPRWSHRSIPKQAAKIPARVFNLSWRSLLLTRAWDLLGREPERAAVETAMSAIVFESREFFHVRRVYHPEAQLRIYPEVI
jgi:hypothetical protein